MDERSGPWVGLVPERAKPVVQEVAAKGRAKRSHLSNFGIPEAIEEGRDWSELGEARMGLFLGIPSGCCH